MAGNNAVLNRIYATVNRRFTMKYRKEERMEIGRRIYDCEIDRYAAAEEYGISEQTAREYMRLYRKINGLPAKRQKRTVCAPSVKKAPAGMDELKGMTKEELIAELVKARITEARLKKGYEVKGDGTVIQYGSKNTR